MCIQYKHCVIFSFNTEWNYLSISDKFSYLLFGDFCFFLMLFFPPPHHQ